jgi:hypothetical protein
MKVDQRRLDISFVQLDAAQREFADAALLWRQRSRS